MLNVSGSAKAITDQLSWSSQKQVPFALALSLTRTAKFVQGKLQQEIARSFDRPTPFTLNALYVSPATKEKLEASVKVKDEASKGNPAIRFLSPEISGGPRHLKGFEALLQRAGMMPNGWYAIPAKAAPLDAYGNVTGATINRILSQLQASRDPLVREQPGAKQKRNHTALMGRYFVALPGRQATAHLQPGIYERLSAGHVLSLHGGSVIPVFIYTPRRPKYSQRFRFWEVAEQTAQMRWPIEFGLAMSEALRTAR